MIPPSLPCCPVSGPPSGAGLFWSTDSEIRRRVCIAVTQLDPADKCGIGALPEPGLERGYCLPIATDQAGYRAVGLIARVTGQAQPTGFLPGAGAEEHALYPAGYTELSTDVRAHGDARL